MSKRSSEHLRGDGPQGKVARTDDVVAGVVKKTGTFISSCWCDCIDDYMSMNGWMDEWMNCS